jgi:hypothetical protein
LHQGNSFNWKPIASALLVAVSQHILLVSSPPSV